MADKVIYNCEKCGKKVETAETESGIPECCEIVMVKAELPGCDMSSTAEHSRLEGGDACDDGRSGS